MVTTRRLHPTTGKVQRKKVRIVWDGRGQDRKKHDESKETEDGIPTRTAETE